MSVVNVTLTRLPSGKWVPTVRVEGLQQEPTNEETARAAIVAHLRSIVREATKLANELRL